MSANCPIQGGEERKANAINNHKNATESGGDEACDVIDYNNLSNDLENLWLSEEYSDVIFITDDGIRISAHRIILATRSRYFKSLLFNGMKESCSKDIKLVDTNSDALRVMIQYCYCGRVNLKKLEHDTLLECLGLAHRYELLNMMESISDYLKLIINTQNLCAIMNTAQFYSLFDLVEYCLSFCDEHASQLLQLPAFVQLSSDSLCQLLMRNSFYAPEIDIFYAVQNWSKANSADAKSLQSLLNCVRLTLISQKELLENVRSTKLISAEDLLDAISIQTGNREAINFRGLKKVDINLATTQNTGYSLQWIVNGQPTKQRSIEKGTDAFFIDLGKHHIINMIEIEFYHASEIPNFYYKIETSVEEGGQWKRVVDYSSYPCKRQQVIYFEEHVMRYIRIEKADEHFPRLVAKCVQMQYSSNPMPIDPTTGLIIPRQNVLKASKDAVVIEGISRSKNALINGEVNNYDWDTGYTCHSIGNGSIIVELPQPYLLSSMRMLLWELDDRNYSYKIDVSTDNNTWTTVIDKSQEKCRGWQDLSFDPIPTTFIKLVGTRNSSNEVFHVVHLEAPSSTFL